MPRLLHAVIARLVEQLDRAAACDHEPAREAAALNALRHLLVIEGSEVGHLKYDPLACAWR